MPLSAESELSRLSAADDTQASSTASRTGPTGRRSAAACRAAKTSRLALPWSCSPCSSVITSGSQARLCGALSSSIARPAKSRTARDRNGSRLSFKTQARAAPASTQMVST